MAEENNDANTGTEDAPGADPSSDTVELEPITGDDGLVSTMEYQEKEVDTSKSDDISEDAEQNTSEDQEPEKKDFHDEPRFKELIEEKNELKREIEKLKTPPVEKQEQTPSFDNIMNMDDDDIVDKVATDPKAFFSNFAQQIMHEIKSDLKAEQKTNLEKEETATFETTATKTYEDFFKDKTDGQAMVDDGRIAEYVNSNPGHNAISAYYALSGDALVQEKVSAAVNKAEERIYKELKAAGKSKSTSTPTGNILNQDKTPEMKNPDKFGGRENVLLKRLLARQAS